MKKLLAIKGQFKQIHKTLDLLSKKNRNRLLRISVFHFLLGVVDLVGIAVIGVIASIAIRGIQSSPPDSRVLTILELIGISQFSFQTQSAILAITASLILVTRSTSSYLISKNTYYFLSDVACEISDKLFSKLANTNLLTLKHESPHRLLHAATGGVTSIATNIIGPVSLVISDLSLLLIIGFGIAIFDPLLVFSIVTIFSVVLVVVYRLTRERSITAAKILRERGIESGEISLEFIDSYREAFVKDRRHYYFGKISRIRREVAGAVAEQAWLPNISKYSVEISVTIGSILIAAIQFLSKNAVDAVGAFAVFLAAGTRITPALLRIQQNAFLIEASLVTSEPTINLLDDLNNTAPIHESNYGFMTQHVGFVPKILISDLSFKYPIKADFTLQNINFEINPGNSIAIVGSSGVGKSTLVDLILGLLTPSSGKILISDLDPISVIKKFPGAIGYVPQDISIYNGTIRSNIGLGFDTINVKDELAFQALNKANLLEFVNNLDGGLDHLVDARGSNLSSGQRQRLGIARALITAPKLLILDEATSSLDNETEKNIIENLITLKSDLTLIVVAHRLSALRKLDSIVYLEDGKVIGIGDFNFLRRTVPNFDKQASIAGL
jgi:ATP-binding cassette, subfamily B, bacterial PglK